MVPRKKPAKANPTTEQEEEEEREERNASISGRGLKLTLPLSQRSGEILIYAISFAIVIGIIGLVVAQVITALRITGGSVKESLGFVLWMSTTFIFASLLRSQW